MSSISRSRSRSPVNDGSRSRSRSPRQRGERRRMVVSRRVIISNIPYDMKWQDIKDLFRKEVGDVTYVELWENPDGKPKGSGIIEFKDKETAQKAVDKMHRYDLKGRDLVVREERESDRLKMSGGMGGGSMGMGGGGMGMGGSSMGMGGSSMGMGGSSMGMGGGGMGMGGGGMGMGMGGGMGMGMGGGMMAGEMGGISPQVLQQLEIDGPISNTVFVSNLDYKVPWQKLKDVFRLAGNVIRAEIKQDKDGKSRGMGTVQFEFPMEALQAISMFNNQTLYDRAMRVRMDSASAPDPVENVQLPSGLKSVGMRLGFGGTPLKQLNSMSGMGGGSNGMGMGIGSMDSSGMGSGMGRTMGSGMSVMSRMGMGGMSGMSGMSGMGTGMKQGTMGMGMGFGLGASLSSGMGMNDSFSTGMGGSNTYGTSSGMGVYGGLGSGMGSGNFSSSMMDSFGSRMTSSGAGYGMSSLDRMHDRDRDRDRSRTGTTPDNCTVSVKNCPYSYGWQTLKEKFREVGDVKFAEVKMKFGKSTGWGLVRFGNSDDAQRAVELMNRAKFDGREVDVRIYRG